MNWEKKPTHIQSIAVPDLPSVLCTGANEPSVERDAGSPVGPQLGAACGKTVRPNWTIYEAQVQLVEQHT